MSHRRVDPLALACVVFVAALAVAFAFLVRRELLTARTSEERIQPSPASLSIRYQQDAGRIVGNFLKLHSALPSPNDSSAKAVLDPLGDARRNLVALVVPNEFRELHVELVAALTTWEDGVRSGRNDIAAHGAGALTLLLDENPWLGRTLSSER